MFPLLDYRGPLPHEKYADHFKVYEHIRDSEHCEDDRAALRDLWEQFEKLGLADPMFVERFPTEFGARVWEMRLACTFAGWGWKLVPSKRRGHGPDLGIEMSSEHVMWVEATAPGNADGADAIHAPPRVILNGDDIDRRVMLRYLNAISEKRSQYKRWRDKGIVGEADGFVIAISGSMVPEGHVELDELPRIVKLAFGLGKQTFIVPIGDTGEQPRVGPRQTALTVAKNTRSGETKRIAAGLFLDDEGPEVSAIIFSGAHFKIRPEAHGKEPGRDFVLVHNPFAHVSFPFDCIKSGREFFMGVDVRDHRAGVEDRDGRSMSDGRVTSAPSDEESAPRRPVTIYLDTSDLSYLVKERGPGVNVSPTRDRLVGLLRSERARLVVSFVHLAEMAIDDATSDAALRWLDTGPPIWCFTTSPEAIFRAELLGESLTIDAQPLTSNMVESLRLRLRAPMPSVAAGTVARGVRWIAEAWAKAEKLSKRAAARRPGTTAKEHAVAMREQRRIAERVVRGNHHDLPVVARIAAGVLLPIARWMTAWNGVTLDDVQAHGRLPPGCAWFAGSVPPATWRDAAKRVMSSPRDAPASALRVAIDAGRPAQPGFVYDVRHLAYAARCDFATIDGPNFRATTRVRAQLARPTFFQTAHLDEVVGAVAHRTNAG